MHIYIVWENVNNIRYISACDDTNAMINNNNVMVGDNHATVSDIHITNSV